MFIYQKAIDRSTLRQGFQIPAEYHAILDMMPEGKLHHGETRAIKIMIDGKTYDAQLKNQFLDRSKFGDHADVIQIRYGENSPISRKLREVFHLTWEYVDTIKKLSENIGRKLLCSEECMALADGDAVSPPLPTPSPPHHCRV